MLFNAPPSRGRGPLDLERLLVDTATACPGNPRLFIGAATWLADYSPLIAAHRLRRLAQQQLAPRDQATLGLLVETAVEHGAQKYLRKIAATGLAAAPEPGPLFDVDRRLLGDRLQDEATALSKKWGRWCQEIRPKPDTLRPAEWILAQNPAFRRRAVRKGDLRSSILETLERDVDEAVCELELARLCDATPVAVRSALSELMIESERLYVEPSRGRNGSKIGLS